MTPASVSHPRWGSTSPWAARQLSAMTMRWKRGNTSCCDHRRPGCAAGEVMFLSPTVGAVVCDGPCTLGLNLRVASRLTHPVPCDGCGEVLPCTMAFVDTVNPRRFLVVGLCARCLASGPSRQRRTRAFDWALGSSWVAECTHAALLAWAQGRLTACSHRRINLLRTDPTIFNNEAGTVRCPDCQAAAEPGHATSLCEGCSAAPALLVAALSHADTPEYTVLVPLCATCATNGPVSARD